MKIYQATLFGQTLPFSSKQEAEKALTIGIFKNFQGYMYGSDASVFRQYMQREDWEMALRVYNKSAAERGHYSGLYLTRITECDLDALFF